MAKKNAWRVEPKLIDRFLDIISDNGFEWSTGHKANGFKPLWEEETLLFTEEEPKTLLYMRYSTYLDDPEEEYNISEVTEKWLDEREHDNVNHPSHYKGIEGLEVRTVQENFVPKYEKYGVMVACDIKDSIKYILRAPDKSGVEDLKKAVRMLNYVIEGWENEQ